MSNEEKQNPYNYDKINYMDILKFENVSFKVDNNKEIKNVYLNISEGESTLVYSYLNDAIYLIDLIYFKKGYLSGEILYFDQDIIKFNNIQFDDFRSSDLSYISHNSKVYDELSVRDNVVYPIIINKSEIDNEYFQDLIKIFGFENNIDLSASQLSAFQKCKVVIMRSLITKPFILLINDITKALSQDEKIDIIKTLNRFNSIYKTTIIHSTSDADLLNYASKVIIIDNLLVSEV